MKNVVEALCGGNLVSGKLNTFVITSLDVIRKHPRQQLKDEVKTVFSDLCMVPDCMKVVIFFYTLNREKKLRDLVCSESIRETKLAPLEKHAQESFFEGLKGVCEGHTQYSISDDEFVSKILEVYEKSMSKSSCDVDIPQSTEKRIPKKKRRIEKM